MTYSKGRTPMEAEERGTAEVVLLPHLLSIARSVRQLVGIKLADCSVAPGQDQFLLCFEDRSERSVAEIAAALSVRASTTSKMIDILVAKGWVSRKPDENDARRVLVLLTDKGREVRDEVRAIWQNLEAELAPGLTDRSQSLAVLAEVESVLNRRLRRLR